MKIRPVQAAVLHPGAQTDRHEKDNSLFIILPARCMCRHTHTV